MKKIFVIVAFMMLGTTVSFAQDLGKANTEVKAKKVVKKAKITKTTKNVVKSEVEGAGMKFVSETVDYGTINQNADGKREFVFVNNGNKPLIITNATGSCGCTVPSYPKEPIMPGQKAVIGVKYDTSRVGAISKTVTITSNAEGTPSKVLNIKGTVNGVSPTVTPATAVKS